MTCRTRLFTREPVLVPVQALANMAHDAAMEVTAPVGPIDHAASLGGLSHAA